MEAIAKLNDNNISPRKMRLVVDSIRGRRVFDALNILKHQTKAGSPYIEKLLLSAVANWIAKNPSASIENADLIVKSIYVTEGKMLKRFRPAPQGRAHRIRKRSNHVTVVVSSLNTVSDSAETATNENAQ